MELVKRRLHLGCLLLFGRNSFLRSGGVRLVLLLVALNELLHGFIQVRRNEPIKDDQVHHHSVIDLRTGLLGGSLELGELHLEGFAAEDRLPDLSPISEIRILLT